MLTFIMEECYEHDGRLLIAENGGSAAESEHIAGKLMKRFEIPRLIPDDFGKKFIEIDSVRWEEGVFGQKPRKRAYGDSASST